MRQPIANQESTIANRPSAKLNNPRTLNGWALFDWANSAFALVITTAIFPPYFEGVTDPSFSVLGLEFNNSSWYSYLITFSYLAIALFSPLLAGIADSGGRRKWFLRVFTLVGGLACIALFFFTGMDTLWLGSLAFVIGMIGFAGGLVFYNSFLPLIATEDRLDGVSARGFALGFLGSVLLLIFILVVIQNPASFGLPAEGTLPVRLSFLLVGLWWLGFATLSLSRLPADVRKPASSLGEMAQRGWREFLSVWARVRSHPPATRFLTAFFCYSAGAQTTLYLASIFASKELGFETSELIVIIILLQVLAIFGAYAAAWLSKARGNKFGLYVILVIWAIACFSAYIVNAKPMFYVIAGMVGLVMGGVQSLSRSTYAKVIPGREDTTSWFSFYDILEKLAIVLGTFIFGALDNFFGSMRPSFLVLSLFFVAGMVFLSRFRLHPTRS